MDTTSVKAIELVFDWNMWPRQAVQKLDSTNLARMRATLSAGFGLPPIIVNKKDYRIVDGFHRTKAVLDVLGDDAEIAVEFREYENDSAMFLEAGALNSYHGLTMSPKDRAHFILKCRKMKIPPAAIAGALRIDPKQMKEFIKNRSAKTKDGELIPLAAGARGLAGKELTETQEHYARTANGCLPEMYASMLLNALNANAFTVTPKTANVLRRLRDVIDEFLEEVD